MQGAAPVMNGPWLASSCCCTKCPTASAASSTDCCVSPASRRVKPCSQHRLAMLARYTAGIMAFSGAGKSPKHASFTAGQESFGRNL